MSYAYYNSLYLVAVSVFLVAVTVMDVWQWVCCVAMMGVWISLDVWLPGFLAWKCGVDEAITVEMLPYFHNIVLLALFGYVLLSHRIAAARELFLDLARELASDLQRMIHADNQTSDGTGVGSGASAVVGVNAGSMVTVVNSAGEKVSHAVENLRKGVGGCFKYEAGTCSSICCLTLLPQPKAIGIADETIKGRVSCWLAENTSTETGSGAPHGEWQLKKGDHLMIRFNWKGVEGDANEYHFRKTADEVDEWKRCDVATGLVQDDGWAVTLTPL